MIVVSNQTYYHFDLFIYSNAVIVLELQYIIRELKLFLHWLPRKVLISLDATKASKGEFGGRVPPPWGVPTPALWGEGPTPWGVPTPALWGEGPRAQSKRM